MRQLFFFWRRKKAPSDPVTETSDTAEDDEPRWEVSAQWARTWRTLKWVVYGVAALMALLIVGQIYLFASLFSDISPLLGGAFVGLVTVGLGLFVVRPTIRMLHLPAAADPPEVELDDPDLNHKSVIARVEYDLTYLQGMRANPALAEQRMEIGRAIADLEGLKARDSSLTPRALGDEINRFEESRILPLLAPLDAEVDAYIRKEALGVGTATAVSLNGTVDAFVVLWRNINMISRIARLYYGRPSLRLSARILGDVATAVVLSRVADDISEAAGDTLGGLFNRLGGIVAGPVMDGSINALMTLKLGYAAKKRCRSFDVWSRKKAFEAAREVFNQVKSESAGLIGDVLGAVGGITGAAIGVAQKAFSAPRSAWSLVQNTVMGRGNAGDDAPPADARP